VASTPPVTLVNRASVTPTLPPKSPITGPARIPTNSPTNTPTTRESVTPNASPPTIRSFSVSDIRAQKRCIVVWMSRSTSATSMPSPSATSMAARMSAPGSMSNRSPSWVWTYDSIQYARNWKTVFPRSRSLASRSSGLSPFIWRYRPSSSSTATTSGRSRSIVSSTSSTDCLRRARFRRPSRSRTRRRRRAFRLHHSQGNLAIDWRRVACRRRRLARRRGGDAPSDPLASLSLPRRTPSPRLGFVSR